MKAFGLVCLLTIAAADNAVASGFSDFNAGISAHNDRNQDDVVRYMTRALAAPDLPQHLRATAFYDRADSYAALKKDDLAIADYTSALALAPDNYSVLIDRGSLYEEKKQYDKARADFAAAVRRRPDLMLGYVSDAQANIDDEKYDDAIKDYNDGLIVWPDNSELITLRGEAQGQAGRYERAMKDFGYVIHRYSYYTTAYVLRARLYQKMGNTHAAASDYGDALDLDPDDSGLRESAGIAQWEDGNYRDAARNFLRSAADTKRAAFSYLWLYLTGIKRGVPASDLAQSVAQLDLTVWPGPIVKLFLGQAVPADVFAAAKKGDRDAQKDQMCQANFFVAEWQLSKSDKAAAKDLLNEATTMCLSEVFETRIARNELARLGQ
jgi:lipoprotein NlpI